MLNLPITPRSLYYGQLVNRACHLNDGLELRLQVLPQRGKGNTWFDDSGKSRHGTLTSGPTWQGPLGRPGAFGSIKFVQASSQYVLTDYAALLTDFTAGCWFYPTANSAGQYYRLIDKKYDTGFWLGHDGTAGGNQWGGGILESGSPFGHFVTLPLNTWNFLVMTRVGTTKTIYGFGGDGTYVTTSAAVSGSAIDSTVVRIGSDNTLAAAGFMEGYEDDIFIHNYGMSESAIKARHQDSFLGYLQTINRVRPATVFDAGAVAAGGPWPWHMYDLAGGLHTLGMGV